jgi:NADH-ubiquinone oxidoreductase chain 5
MFVVWSFFKSGSVEIELIYFLVVLAPVARSAWIPFPSWLPAAVAARSPVSALVHCCTMVTAGVC